MTAIHEEAPSTGKPATPDVRTRTPLRVLAVEGNPADVELSVRELDQAGYEVQVNIAQTHAQFVALLDAGQYDVVLAAYCLPEWTATHGLAELGLRAPDVPLILVTGSLGEERAVDCVKQGAADYVLKGHLGRLPISVHRVLEERDARIESRLSEDLIRKLTLAVDQVSISVVITDLKGTIEYVNRYFSDVTGFSREEAIGQTPRLIRSGLTPVALYRDLWQKILSGRAWHGDLHNRRKNGELYWDSVTITPIRNPAGLITHFLASQEDITARKLAEQALRDREERFRQLSDNIKEVFFVMDTQYREMLYINPAYEKIWGRSCQSLHADPRSFFEPILPQDQAIVLRSIARIQQGEDPGEFEFRLAHPDGSIRWILSHAVPIRNEQGEVYRISGVALDITERRRAQEALEEREAQFHKIIEATFDGIAIIVDGVMREVNSGLLKIFGYDKEEDVIGRPVLDFVSDESKTEVANRVSAAVDGTYEAIGKRKDGSRILLDVTARTHDIGGRPGRLVALRDVTEKRTLEEQFRQSQKMEAIGRLAGGVAHDFNNLLTVITSYSDILLSDLGAGDPRREDLDQIRQAAIAAASLTRQLLAFSRQQVIQPRLVNLEDIVSNSHRMLRRLIGEDIDLVTTLRPEPTTVKIDPGQMEQVIMNLTVNARDAMPAGGKLTIETGVVDLDDSNIRSHWPATRGRYAMLAVSDTGSGMDEQTRVRIFEPFFTTKEVGKGTGLGLATVYGIVKQNNGFIWVYSEPGQGSAFKIYLPLVAEPVGPRESQSVTPEVTRGSETILLVEDAVAVRGVARQILKRYGYTVLEASSGTPALELAAKHSGPIHLLLTDVVMPGMSGRVLGEQFAELRPDTRILYMSGYTDDAIVRHSVLQPGIAYLQKPFSPETLARTVREVLDNKGQGVELLRREDLR